MCFDASYDREKQQRARERHEREQAKELAELKARNAAFMPDEQPAVEKLA